MTIISYLPIKSNIYITKVQLFSNIVIQYFFMAILVRWVTLTRFVSFTLVWLVSFLREAPNLKLWHLVNSFFGWISTIWFGDLRNFIVYGFYSQKLVHKPKNLLWLPFFGSFSREKVICLIMFFSLAYKAFI